MPECNLIHSSPPLFGDSQKDLILLPRIRLPPGPFGGCPFPFIPAAPARAQNMKY